VDDVGRYRCSHCGNKTRFDIFERLERRVFAHYDLAGQMNVDEEETISRIVLRVVCRWCDRDDGVGPAH
jgi:ribosomal protein L44E